ncbi:MAG: hypothetical protein ACTSVU_09760 [Promethearchaeota archaeon]
MSNEAEEMPTMEGNLLSFPATILKLLNVDVPLTLPVPLTQVVDLFSSKGPIDRVVINMIDNFGLFEITYYKPKFLISNADALVLLSTQNPYTLGVFHQMLFGDFKYRKNDFHLFEYLQSQGKTSVFVGREKDVKRYASNFGISKANDMSTWIEAAKVINRHDLSWLHWLDFEEIHRTRSRTTSPEELIQKLISRTDKWILSQFKQLRSRSLMVVIGNHGRNKIDLNYQGKVAQWRAASVPLAILLYKP